MVRELDPGLQGEDLTDLLVAVSETVTNAMKHGRPPVRVRAWTAPGRMVVTVTDARDGPADPLIGLMPAGSDEVGGRGLWIAHQACAHVSTARDAEGWTIRMIAGSPAG
ncbi:ATP-binding protein [Winogradskya humida]|uniref:Histidine kinase/HSP90-like ATPase domain-containing protein n=1 Tax=Winogradskya humida TaxID=113566 RepID=A0ABQ3ZJX6_9ACTN|nr:ATP-binding protein [Actinoplanes humidus]GIE18881.1 hypothetical protein Ahu01nite_019830 [Actinoplanes humidus]